MVFRKIKLHPRLELTAKTQCSSCLFIRELVHFQSWFVSFTVKDRITGRGGKRLKDSRAQTLLASQQHEVDENGFRLQ